MKLASRCCVTTCGAQPAPKREFVSDGTPLALCRWRTDVFLWPLGTTVQTRDLVELAGFAASHGTLLVRGGPTVALDAGNRYWTAAKCRIDRWTRALRRLKDELARTGKPPSPTAWRKWGPVFEEILSGEILARVWAAVSALREERGGGDVAEPVSRSVLLGQLEARNRAVTILLQTPGLSRSQGAAINRLRRRCERWSDVLVGRLLACGDVTRFAVDANRAKEFADDEQHDSHASGKQSWEMFRASLRRAFAKSEFGPSPNPDLNADIATSVLSCFPPEAFDEVRDLQSLWLLRLTQTANDASGMVAMLLAER